MRAFFALLALILPCTWAIAQPATDERSITRWAMLYPGAPGIHIDADLPVVFQNDLTTQVNIRSVACYVVGGKVTIIPTLTGKARNSVLKQPLVCPPDVWSAGVLNGSPVLRSFSANGATCSTQPCTMDLNIEQIEGTPTYMIVKIVGRVPRSSTARVKLHREN